MMGSKVRIFHGSPFSIMKTNTSLREFLKKTWLWLALLGGLVCFRTLPFFLYPGLHFDSDQATFGMMAIHLAKLQALPVFMYGQKYLLALQSYFAAPFFMFMNEQTVVPSLLIKIPELLTNLLTVWLLFFILVRKLLLKPSFAFLIALPLALPAIALSAQWMNASGGHIEPILLVLILYLVRYRPVLFAVVAAIAVLHREWLLAPVLALWVMLYFERRTGSAPLSNLPKKMLRKRLVPYPFLFLQEVYSKRLVFFFFFY